MSYESLIERVLLSETEISELCGRLGAQISEDYRDKKLLLVGILKGSVMFMADLMKNITCDCQIDFMTASSYCGTKTTGAVKIKKDLDLDPKGFDILIVEDILESGTTLSSIKELLAGRGASSVKICTLLDKPDCRKTAIEADYIGKQIPKEFVVGYGLDYDEKYRNLPFIGVLKPECYSR